MAMRGANGFWTKAFSGLLPAALLLVPAADHASGLTMLDQLQRGEWELRFRDDTPTRRICLHSGRELLQLRHPNRDCSHYVVDNTPKQLTVQYTCPGRGYGLTTIRKETGGLVQINGSGLVDSTAFDFTAEARRIGDCR